MKILIDKLTSTNGFYGYIFLLILMATMPAIVFSQDMESEVSIANDIYMALTLQGIKCDEISELDQGDDNSYDVACKNGGRYSISQTKDGILNVVDSLTGIVRKGIGQFLGNAPLAGQIFQQKDEITEHDAEVARSLFSIIEMSGNVCEAITAIESNASDEHIVSCASGQTYRVYTNEDGLVAVDALTGGGS